MNVSLDMPTTQRASLHARALKLAGIFFALFLVAAGLYARFGYAFVLRVFEQHQLGRAADAKGESKLVEYEDYLRVDPANLLMRGLLINQLIEFRDPTRALVVAQEGVSAVPATRRYIAMLLIARAQIASVQFNDAEHTLRNVLAAGESGEAHYGLAHIAAAGGDFKAMREEYKKCYRQHPRNSSPDFSNRVDDATWKNEWGTMSKPYASTDDAELVTLLLPSEQAGHIDSTLEGVGRVHDFNGAPSLAIFLRGVNEEEQGHGVLALNFYKRAADAGDALGKFAYARLGGK